MKLEQNGKEGRGKRTKHFNIKLFCITDLIKRGVTIIKYCPSNRMVADIFIKPIIGEKIQILCKSILNI